MLLTIVSWIYIFFITLSIGVLVNRALSKIIPVPGLKEMGTVGFVTTGLVSVTVYAEVFSILYKIGAICHLVMLAVAVAGFVTCREKIVLALNRIRRSIFGKRIVIYALIILGAAFFASRGTFHTDTGIYHAQAIRLLEEYGIIKGLGNLQLHYAYNSAYLPLCALFSMSFILPSALHTMTGFFMALYSSYAVAGLLEFTSHSRHGGDFARIGLLIYAFTNMTGLQSPATDYGTMFMTMYIMTAWISYAEERAGSRETTGDDLSMYGYLSVLSIFVVSMKLSAALLVILAIFPFVILVRKKMWRELASFLLIGFLSFLPYLVRNVILSGWLFYPVEAIDLFNVIWKIPAEYMRVDSAQIKVWGRCLYDITRVDEGISSWLPLWWENKEHYEEMLIYSQFVGGALLTALAVIRLIEKKLNPAVIVFYLTILANIALWFMTAPFIRYGLAFLLLLPLCTAGDLLDHIEKKKSYVLIGLTALVAVNFFSWIDNYFMDNLVFVKHNLTAGYYINPIPFEEAEMYAYDMDGETIYIAGPYEKNSYYTCPSTCYDFMAERTQLIGSTVKEGFMAKPK